MTGGGGGYGDPKARPAEEVAADVLDGYLSVEAASATMPSRSIPPPAPSIGLPPMPCDQMSEIRCQKSDSTGRRAQIFSDI